MPRPAVIDERSAFPARPRARRYRVAMRRSRTWATTWSALRLVMAALIAAAVIAQLIRSVSGAVEAGRDVATIVANFFSFFTILSNIAAAGVLAWAGVLRLAPRRREAVDPPALAVALLCVTTYLATTGAVYNLLLRAISIGPDTVAWANEVMHVWAPLLLVTDLLFGTGHRAVRWRAAFAALVFPLAWIAYTLLRAPLITAPSSGTPYWYPYPFLDPHDGGWASVFAYVAAIAVGILAVAIGGVAALQMRRTRTPPWHGQDAAPK